MKLLKTKPALSVFIFSVLSTSAGISPADNRIEHLSELLDNFNEKYYQQKIYLHTDKSDYKAGENIWFKAYAVDAMNHTPDKKSTNLYIEFINPDKSVIEIKRIQLKNGFGAGDLILQDTLKEGLYQIRAYTNWMKNFDSEFYFTKNISLKNPDYVKHISPSNARKNKRIIKKDQENHFSVQFFPEGGNLISGLESKVAFKAININGKSIDITGVVHDSKKNKIAEFYSSHKGMGYFEFKPEKDKSYFAIIENNNKQIKVDMPKSLETGIVMNVNNSDSKKTNVSIISNIPVSGDKFANEIVVIAQIRGRIFYKEIHDISPGRINFDIEKSGVPTGIAQITIFSGRFVPLAERLLFIDNDDNIKIQIENGGKNKDNLQVLRIKTLQGNSPVNANLSLSVFDAENTANEEFNGYISDYLLLKSDLKGYIEDPGFYFKNKNDFTRKALDNLLLTQGWRRFEWGNLVNGEFPDLSYHFEKNITVDGKITSEIFAIPAKNANVTLSILDEFNDVFEQNTGKDGSFKFDGLVYYDTVNVRIEARRPTGRKNVLIVIEDPVFEEVKNFYGDYSLTTISERDQKEYRRKMNLEAEKQMKEAEKAENERNKIIGIYGEPDAVIKSEDIPDGYSNVLQAIQGRVPGVDVRGDNVVIRGIHTFYGNTDPLYLVDGVPVNDVNTILSIPVEDVDRIEILKGPSTAIYGSRGGNGVIAVYTKRGEFMKKGVIEFQMLGYSTPRQFYIPEFKYSDNTDYKPQTIFWAPVVETNASGEATVYLKLPDNVKKLRFVAEGLSYDGKTGEIDKVF